MADSECGVACHRKMNNVGKKMSGCLMAAHNWKILCLELFRKPELVLERLCPLVAFEACSFTRIATPDVINGRKAVMPKTYLQYTMMIS